MAEFLYMFIELLFYGLLRFGAWKDGKVSVSTIFVFGVLAFFNTGTIATISIIVFTLASAGFCIWLVVKPGLKGVKLF